MIHSFISTNTLCLILYLSFPGAGFFQQKRVLEQTLEAWSLSGRKVGRKDIQGGELQTLPGQWKALGPQWAWWVWRHKGISTEEDKVHKLCGRQKAGQGLITKGLLCHKEGWAWWLMIRFMWDRVELPCRGEGKEESWEQWRHEGQLQAQDNDCLNYGAYSEEAPDDDVTHQWDGNRRNKFGGWDVNPDTISPNIVLG